MQGYLIPRRIRNDVLAYLDNFPVVAILGPRQAGKSTLAQKIVQDRKQTVYLDLEKPSDLRKLSEPEMFFQSQGERMICLDEIQRTPDLFTVLRSVVDQDGRNGRFLILGSASPDLIKQSSETLAGRIVYLELSPFDLTEIQNGHDKSLTSLWLKGGFPRSFLVKNNNISVAWRENFIRTFLERDIPQHGFKIPAESLRRLWLMCAHNHGQLLNASRLGESLGVSHLTVRSYIDLFKQTFMLRVLPPMEVNLKKRLVKSPKIYVRDSGILHALLEIESFDGLIGHPVYGASWEGFALENILSLLPRWRAGFYGTSSGAELDLVLARGQRKIGVEFKASKAPKLTRGFWNSIDDLELSEVWVIAPIEDEYPIKENVRVSGLMNFLDYLRSLS